jgi:hypothetical protein
MSEDRFQFASRWNETPEYRALVDQTPPLPCPFCIAFSRLCEGAPKEPCRALVYVMSEGRRKRSHNADLAAAWTRYQRDVRAIIRIAEAAALSHTVEACGGRDLAVQVRRERREAFKRKIDAMHLEEDIKMVRTRVIGGKQLTPHDKAIWREHEGAIRGGAI